MIHKLKLIPILLMPLAMASCDQMANDAAAEADHPDGLLHIKEVSRGTNSSNQDYVTLSYTITPLETTYRNFTISAAWKTSVSSSVDDYVDYSINTAAQTFTVTKLQDFSTIIVVTLQNSNFQDVTASVEFHNSQRFLGWNEGTTQKVDHAPFNAGDGWEYNGLQSWSNYAGLSKGYSTAYTDSITKENATIQSYDIVTTRYYTADVVGWGYSNARYYFTSASKVNLIASGRGELGQGTRGTASTADDWINQESVYLDDLIPKIIIDRNAWTDSQRNTAGEANYVILEVTLETQLECCDVVSPEYTVEWDFILPKTLTEGLFSVDAQSVSTETTSYTF